MLLLIFQILCCQAPIINDSSCRGLVAEGSGSPVPIAPGSPSARVKNDQHFLLLTLLRCLYSMRCSVPGFCKTKFPVQPGIEKMLFHQKSTSYSSKWWLLVIFFFLRQVLPDGCLLHILKNVMGKTSTDDDHLVPY